MIGKRGTYLTLRSRGLGAALVHNVCMESWAVWLTVLNGVLALIGGSIGLSLYWGRAERVARITQLQQAAEQTNDESVRRQLVEAAASAANDVASRLLRPWRTNDVALSLFITIGGTLLLVIVVVDETSTTLAQRISYLVGLGLVTVGLLFLTFSFTDAALARALWLAEHEKVELAVKAAATHDVSRASQWIVLTLPSAYASTAAAYAVNDYVYTGVTRTLVSVAVLGVPILLWGTLTYRVDRRQSHSRRQLRSLLKKSADVQSNSSERDAIVEPFALHGRRPTLPERVEDEGRQEALAHILAAEPMPVPEDPHDLRVELDALHGRHG